MMRYLGNSRFSVQQRLLLLVWILHFSAMVRGEEVDFQRQILPILSENCLLCHGPDSTSREAGLRLDVRDSAISQLDSGFHAIKPGSTQESELIQRIKSTDPFERMPPEESGKQLTEEQMQLLSAWIEQGANYAQHWAFESIVRPPVPELDDDSWVHNPIDRFVLSRMLKNGLSPTKPASHEKLVRRLYFDLIGLPPTPEQIDEFNADLSPGAAERVVSKLFQSEHYGEWMAVSWLDCARYADTNGYQNDFARTMWVWRDWVIRAFNENMPFDQFAIEQIAGDLLPGATQSQLVATGFNRNNRTVTEAGSIPQEWLVENVIDRVETTSTVFLGLTMGCCRCHDHKYDPISQQEFYEFFAFFNNVEEKGVYSEVRGNVPPLIVAPTTKQKLEHKLLVEAADAARSRLLSSVSELSQQILQEWRGKELGKIPGELFRFVPASVANDAEESAQIGSGKSDAWALEDGIIGQAVKLKGTGGIQTNLLFSPDFSRAFSAAAWLKPESENGTVISAMEDHAAYRGFDALIVQDMRLAIHLINRWPDNVVKVTTRSRVPKSIWSHLVVAYDGSGKASGLTIYLNGVKQETEVNNDTLSGSLSEALPLRIGQRSSERFFKGSISDVRIFDHSLDIDEIQSLISSALVQPLANMPKSQGLGENSEFANLLATYQGFEGGNELHQIQKEYRKAEQAERSMRERFPTVMIMKERKTRRPTYFLRRGEYDKPDKSQELKPGVPECLPPLPNTDTLPDRLALAKWIVDPSNPLTARVTVNRLWESFFGRGLVPTTNNFGLQAELPSHPELLNWLAAEFIDSGWDMQHMQKLIATSATYQQSSIASREKRQADPYNIFLARGPRFRLPAELIRDNALSISGLLNRNIGGPSVMPYQPEGLWDDLAGGQRDTYTQAKDESLYRRSLYIYRKRTVPHPAMGTFDAPSWEVCQVYRSRTNTPLQALALLNDVTYVEAARKLAERMLREVDGDSKERIAYGFRLATSRIPESGEIAALASSLRAYEMQFRDNASASEQFVSHGQSKLSPDLDVAELAAYTAVATTLLNLDETITKE